MRIALGIAVVLVILGSATQAAGLPTGMVTFGLANGQGTLEAKILSVEPDAVVVLTRGHDKRTLARADVAMVLDENGSVVDLGWGTSTPDGDVGDVLPKAAAVPNPDHDVANATKRMIQKGDLDMGWKRYKLAVKFYKMALAKDPDIAAVYASLAVAYRGLGDEDNAIRCDRSAKGVKRAGTFSAYKASLAEGVPLAEVALHDNVKVYLKSGKLLTGRVTEVADGAITVESADSWEIIKKGNFDRIILLQRADIEQVRNSRTWRGEHLWAPGTYRLCALGWGIATIGFAAGVYNMMNSVNEEENIAETEQNQVNWDNQYSPGMAQGDQSLLDGANSNIQTFKVEAAFLGVAGLGSFIAVIYNLHQSRKSRLLMESEMGIEIDRRTPMLTWSGRF